MNLKSLRAFLYVMDEGALVHASRRMNLSQPAVSRLVNLLEEEVGVKLFYRDQKTLMPTPEAELFYPEAQRIVASLDDLPDLFCQFRSSALVPLRIVSQLRAANGLIIPALGRFAEQYPEVRTTLDFLRTPRAWAAGTARQVRSGVLCHAHAKQRHGSLADIRNRASGSFAQITSDGQA